MDSLVFGTLNKKISGVATGFKSAVKNADGTITVEYIDGTKITTAPLKGDKGDTGEQGVQGIQGIQGEQGVQGERGVTGIGITSVTKQGTSGLTDTYKIAFSDGSETTYDIVNGANVTKTSQLTNDSNFITDATIGLVNYYLKDEVYNKSKIDELLRNVGAGLSVKIVQALPTSQISGTTIYLINTSGSQYNQYMYIDGEWANLGSTTADLSSYYNKTQVDTMLLGYITASTLLTQLMQYTKTSDLATVATSGDYNDLTNLPEIPSTDGFMKARQSLGEVDLNDCVTDGIYTITKTSGHLPSVEIYGSYCDLEVMSIGTVVNQQLRIVVGDTNVPMLWNRSKIGTTWTEWTHALGSNATTNTIVDNDKLIPSSKAVYEMINDTASATDKVYSSSKVEDYVTERTGVIGALTDGVDFNTIIESGKYNIINIHNAVNAPSGFDTTYWGYLVVSKVNDTYFMQELNLLKSGVPYSFIRRKYGNNWSGWKQFVTTDSTNPLPYISTSSTNVLYYALIDMGKSSDKTHLMRVTAISSSGSNVALFTYKHTTSNTKIVISSNNLTITAQNESGTIAYSSTPTRIIVEYIAQLD